MTGAAWPSPSATSHTILGPAEPNDLISGILSLTILSKPSDIKSTTSVGEFYNLIDTYDNINKNFNYE